MSSPSPSRCVTAGPPPPSDDSLSFGSWTVDKFGGTSLAASECYQNAADIIRTIKDRSITRRCIVVSAMGEVKNVGSRVSELIQQRSPKKPLKQLEKVTNYIIRATELAAKNDKNYLEILEQLRWRHISVVTELLGEGEANGNEARTSLLAALEADFTDLAHILRAVWLSKTYDAEHSWWYGFGEIWSARLMCAYLNRLDQEARQLDAKAEVQDAVFIDARQIIHLTQHKDPTPDYTLSRAKLSAWLESSPSARNARIIVVTGYIATTSNGTPTTLGRDGSDYTASIFAALLRSRSVTIWTDVDGVYSANPSQVKDAVILPELSFHEASELAYWGAKVLHPKTMTPVVRHNIPIWIRNTFNAAHPGSCILSGKTLAEHDAERRSSAALKKSPSMNAVIGYGVRGFSEISNLSLLIVEGTGMIGVPGVCARLFNALREAGVSVVLVTQGGSEHSICICVPSIHGRVGLRVIEHEFRDELAIGEIQTVDLQPSVSCLAIVGDGMRWRRGVAARMFCALADAGINIKAIAQGSSERNISVIVDAKEAENGIRAIHQAFVQTESDSITAGYKPMLTPSPPSADSASSSPASVVVTGDSSSPSSQSQLVDRLFPLPLASTILGLHARSIVIRKVTMDLPSLLFVDAGDEPSYPVEFARSQSLASDLIVEVARMLRYDTVKRADVKLSEDTLIISGQAQCIRFICIIEAASDAQVTMTIESVPGIVDRYHARTDEERFSADIRIWTDRRSAPILLQGTIEPDAIRRKEG